MCFRISRYGLVSTKEAVFLVGGNIGKIGTREEKSSIIAKFSNDQWSIVGNLHQGRSSLTAISTGLLIIIIGGWFSDPSP